MRFWASVGLAGLTIGGSISIPAEAANIAPHRAVYELSLQRSSTSSDVVDVSGIMQFEWADACDGWAVTQRSVMTFLYQTGEEVELGWSLVSWEAKDGSRYRFFMRKVENGIASDELRGEAQLEGAGKGGAASYNRPEERTVGLPPGTMFPTAHSLKLLNRAEGGGRMLWASVFDGSDEAGLFGVNAVIMRRFEPKKADASLRPLLTDTPSWSIRLAFFGSGEEATPEHEQSLRLYANGVVEDLLLDYGDFSVEGELTELESLPDADC